MTLEKARAALDRRHILTINYVYELPFFKDQKGIAGKILGGWQASGIITYQTGLPFTPTASSFDASGLGLIPALVAGARPNVTCDPNANAPHTVQQWFNTSCFQVTPISNTDPNFPISNRVGNWRPRHHQRTDHSKGGLHAFEEHPFQRTVPYAASR
jgi:hypothetical protein